MTSPEPRKPHRKTFSLGFSFGKPPEGSLDIRADPGEARSGETAREFTFTIGGDHPQKDAPGETDWEEKLLNLGHAYPDTARVHRALHTVVWAIVIALPLVVLVLTLASGQTQETVFFTTLGALIVGAMFKSTVR